MFKEEFIKVMVIMSAPEVINKQKEAEAALFDIFQQFDEDRSGTIDCNELGKAMEQMGRPMTEDQIENLIVQIDSEGTGAINFVDFASIFGIKATPIDYEATHRADLLAHLAEARATFKTFDFDHSESIDIHELKAIMLAMGRKMSEDQLQKMMNTVDLDGSGEIDFQEFCALLGIEWDEQFGLDLKEIDAFSKANAPKDKNKRRQSVTKKDENREVGNTDNIGPCGMTVTTDPAGYKFLKFSPNGNFLAISGFDSTVKIYEVKSNGKTRRLCSLREHSHTVLCVDWSPLSDRVVTVAADRMLHMWHVKKQICVQSVKAHSAYVRCVEWSRDGTMIATCSSDKTVKLWSPVTLVQTKLMLGHSNWVRIVRFREDSKRLVSAGDDNYLIVWSVPEGQILQRITNLKSPVSDCCLLLRAGYALPPLVIGCLNGDVSIYHPDVGLAGFMHYTIVGIENMYPSPEGMRRYIVFEIGRNRQRLKTVPEQADSFDYESHTDKMVSCRSAPQLP
jgi:Ca2+-binding EF-hand superfamily protein